MVWIIALIGRVTYLFVQEKDVSGIGNFVTQSSQWAQNDLFNGQKKSLDTAVDQKIQQQWDKIQDDTDLEKAAAQLAANEYSTTSLHVDQGTYDIELLEQLYKDAPSDMLAALLLQYYRQEFWHDEARNLLEKHPNLLPNQITRQEALHLYANTSAITVAQPNSVLKLQKKAHDRARENKISAQDKLRYDALVQLWQGGTQTFVESMQWVDDIYYTATQEALSLDQKYAQWQKDVPDYYQQALFGLTLLQHQYLPFAEKISLEVIAKDPNYVLPYQILAYTTFLQRDRAQSTNYIRELLARDSLQRPMYQFMLWVIAFRQWNYQEAILYFLWVEDKELNQDVLRYLSLSYIAVGDMPQAAWSFRKMVTNYDLQASDYYHYFYNAYFHPYRWNVSYELLEEDRELALLYHQSCKQKISEQRVYICDYGEVGQLLVNRQYDQAFKRLLYLAKYYPQSYFFEALGDYYERQWKTQDAIMYYLQAIRFTKDTVEMIDAKRKIQDLIQNQ